MAEQPTLEGKGLGAHGPGAQQRNEAREGGPRPSGQSETLDFAKEEGARAAREAAHVNAQLIERNMESTQQAMNIGLQTTARAFENLAKAMTETFSLNGGRGEREELTQNIQAASRAGAGLTIAAQEASREWLNLARQAMEANLQTLRELGSCRSVQDVASVQSKLVRTNLEQAVQAGKAIAERSQRSLEEVSRALS